MKGTGSRFLKLMHLPKRCFVELLPVQKQGPICRVGINTKCHNPATFIVSKPWWARVACREHALGFAARMGLRLPGHKDKAQTLKIFKSYLRMRGRRR